MAFANPAIQLVIRVTVQLKKHALLVLLHCYFKVLNVLESAMQDIILEDVSVPHVCTLVLDVPVEQIVRSARVVYRYLWC